MTETILASISLIIVISAAIAVIAKFVRQPTIIAYLISGIIVGPLVLGLIGTQSTSELLQASARIGVAFLLFIVGMSLDFRIFKEIGKVSIVSGIIEIIFVSVLGLIAAILMGFSNIASIYIGAAIAFSSTVVVVKILSDKKEIDTLHGKISLGILIVQDIVASIVLMIIPILSNNGTISYILKEVFLAIIIISGVFFCSILLFNRFLGYLAKSQETLFVFAIAWALLLATLFSKIGFSIEIGALIAGMSLASTKYVLDLESKIKPLRDFFVILFFVYFGSQLSGEITKRIILNSVILSAVVMIAKPIIVMTTLKFFGYTKRTNFLTSLSLAQVSEFSLILIFLGFSLGHLSQEIMNLSILVTLITIGLSSYGLNFSHSLTKKISGILGSFDGKIKDAELKKEKKYDIVLFGYHRIGYKILDAIKKSGASFFIVDYNPKVVLSLNNSGIEAVYGDASNKNFLEELGLDKAKLIISTIPEENSNLSILQSIKEKNSDTVFIATAENTRVALDLYAEGADYVIVPHHLGGDYAANMIKEFKLEKKNYKKLGKEHMKSLETGKKNSVFA